MRIEEIAKGEAVEIEVKYDDRKISFKSEILFIDYNSVFITPITVDERTIGFSNNYQVSFLYKLDGRVFIWETVTVKLVKYNGVIYHKVDLDGQGKPYNRRNSYRLYVGEDMGVSVSTSERVVDLTALIKDISDSGVSFITAEDFEIYRPVRINFTADSSGSYDITAVIIRKEFLSHLGSYIYGCQFPEKNLKLGKYIIKKQSEMIKKKADPLTAV